MPRRGLSLAAKVALPSLGILLAGTVVILLYLWWESRAGAIAGEAGKGFAVVANEVKELAKETAKATEEIGQRIEAIQRDTRGTVEAIGQIREIIAQINDYQNTIASAVEEQTATTGEMARSLGEAAVGSAEIARNISSVAVTTQATTEKGSAARPSSL